MNGEEFFQGTLVFITLFSIVLGYLLYRQSKGQRIIGVA